jgi:hypothetical protein
VKRLTLIGVLSAMACAPAAPAGQQQSGDAGSAPAADTGDSSSDAGTPPANPCPTQYFIDVSAGDGPGGDHPDPELSVRCTDTEVIVTSNGIPHYRFERITPNALQEQQWEWRFPLHPRAANTPATIPLLGAIGIAVNGLPIYGPNEAERPDPFGDPVHNDILDRCKGHTGGQGDYHNHTMLVDCLTDDDDPSLPSSVLGFAFDGYPIYGPRGCADADCTRLITYQSSWIQTGDPSTYAWDAHEFRANDAEAQLDRCNGITRPDGSYAYHVTATFPYILGCYHGVATANNRGGGGPGPGDGPPQEARDACDGLAEDAECSFAGRGGRTVTGRCRTTPSGVFACAPDRRP